MADQQPDEDEEESGLVIDEAKPGDTSGNSGTGGGEGPQRPGSSTAGMATNTVTDACAGTADQGQEGPEKEKTIAKKAT